MLFVFLLTAFSLFFYSLDLTDFSASLGEFGQEICKSLSPKSTFQSAYLAMVCGVKLDPGEVSADLRRTGLLHLFVVSGSHLIFLATLVEVLVQKWGPPRKHPQILIHLLLFLYAVLSGFSPPVVRALISIGTSALNARWKLFWSRFDEILFAGLFCLLLFPNWWGSLSFQMSWLASLGLALGKNNFWRCCLIFALMTLPLSGLGIPHPASIAFNWVLGPLFGFLLLPLSLLAFIIPPLTGVIDMFWELFFRFLNVLSQFVSQPQTVFHIPIWVTWLLLATLHTAIRRHLRLKITEGTIR